jgi:ATP-dependent Clp protease ATP-binding subunit ClpC
MLDYQLTERVKRILVSAREEALRLNHNAIGTEHILLSLSRQGEGVAGIVLARLAVRFDKVEKIVEEIAPQRTTQSDPTELVFASDAQDALSLAHKYALEFQQPLTSTEHLLLAFLDDESKGAGSVLRRLGVTPENFRAGLEKILGPPKERRHLGRAPAPRVDDRKPDQDRLLPDLEVLKTALRTSIHNDTALAVLADLDEVPEFLIVGLMSSLDALHRAWGGGGLRLEHDNVFSVPVGRLVRG